ncbi:GNAT family N-acetyltransferase [Saccharophagus degradans]|uniref:GCN5-related N-acetyltransferase n=1 Tax=Saccharophagus degradans (strain 2-40 / ATCC 43961 / DSM 17024) TaxID=203122 RepID=Q21L54_SACD2|nr:GNAT family N-acetyltransferase [Saccharophagus degradans]ABD80575.1 GCN5-related N-acetyltransferase [Saccharophagus degradans 2-40]
MKTENKKIICVDYHNDTHTEDLLAMLNEYASSLEGGAAPLSPATRNNLIPALRERSDAVSLLCYVDNKPVGILNAFEGFSTFNAKPLMNVHDLAVSEAVRGQGIAGMLLDALAKIAEQKNCCKLTLEVLSNNTPAIKCYQNNGFKQYVLAGAMGVAQFWQKNI